MGGSDNDNVRRSSLLHTRRSIREPTRQECGRLKFPSVESRAGSGHLVSRNSIPANGSQKGEGLAARVITVPRSTLFSNPHTNTVMPNESVCRRLAGKINQDCDCKDEVQAAGFLFGVFFDVDGIRELESS